MDGNELECYPNAGGRLCIRLVKTVSPEDSNYITLDKMEVQNLIAILAFYENILK